MLSHKELDELQKTLAVSMEENKKGLRNLLVRMGNTKERTVLLDLVNNIDSATQNGNIGMLNEMLKTVKKIEDDSSK